MTPSLGTPDLAYSYSTVCFTPGEALQSEQCFVNARPGFNSFFFLLVIVFVLWIGCMMGGILWMF